MYRQIGGELIQQLRQRIILQAPLPIADGDEFQPPAPPHAPVVALGWLDAGDVHGEVLGGPGHPGTRQAQSVLSIRHGLHQSSDLLLYHTGPRHRGGNVAPTSSTAPIRDVRLAGEYGAMNERDPDSDAAVRRIRHSRNRRASQ